MNVRKVKKILISQPAPATDKSPYFDIAQKYKAEVEFHPFIKVERISLKEFRHQRIALSDFTAVVLTSKVAVDHFFSFCEELRVMIPNTMKYFCISEQIALYLQKYIVYRKRKIFFSTTGRIDGLSAQFTKNIKEKFIFPVPEDHSDDVTSFLDEKKINYTKSVMYRTVSNLYPADKKFDADLVVFFSPLGVSSLFDSFPNFEQGDIAIGAFGSTTAKALEEHNIRIDCQAPTPEYPSMAGAIEAFMKTNHKK